MKQLVLGSTRIVSPLIVCSTNLNVHGKGRRNSEPSLFLSNTRQERQADSVMQGPSGYAKHQQRHVKRAYFTGNQQGQAHKTTLLKNNTLCPSKAAHVAKRILIINHKQEMASGV